jgi:hypothetical protein
VSQDVDKQQSEHAGAEARGAELREELAITDERRAEEEEAKAEAAVEAARKAEARKERERREAEERRKAAAAAAEEARQHAEPLEPPPGPAHPRIVEGPERPEIHVAVAFAGAFLFARILKKIAE